VLDPEMLYLGLEKQGKKVFGKFDPSTLTDTRLSPPDPFRKVRFPKP
jgi:hypothetical protein